MIELHYCDETVARRFRIDFDWL